MLRVGANSYIYTQIYNKTYFFLSSMLQLFKVSSMEQ